jgi:hypothetical protein
VINPFRHQPLRMRFEPTDQRVEPTDASAGPGEENGSGRRRVRSIDPDHAYVLHPAWNEALRQELTGFWGQAQEKGLVSRAGVASKAQRLNLALWLFAQLSPAQDAQTALNQLACSLDFVETRSRQAALSAGIILPVGMRILRLPQPFPETCHGQPLWVSHAVRHMILVRPGGGVQIQHAPETEGAIDYLQNARQPHAIVLSKGF